MDGSFEKQVHAIIFRVCSDHNVSAEALLGRGGNRFIVSARHEAYKALHFKAKYTDQMIADLFGRDRSSVSKAINRSMG